MLQQTQVERVVPYFNAWMKKYPTVRTLAAAPLGEVLTMWQGLGYNRRAKGLWEAAKRVVEEYKGVLPATPEALELLPGIGPYTARAVCAFAHNTDGIFIETNIRTAVVYHFFLGKDSVTDEEIREILERAYPKGRAREWYAALMDYGSYLKKSGIKLNARTKGYVKQSVFSGSSREARGAILRALSAGPLSAQRISVILGEERSKQVIAQLSKLYQEGLVERRGRTYHLPR